LVLLMTLGSFFAVSVCIHDEPAWRAGRSR
jgi:hypothetical protein